MTKQKEIVLEFLELKGVNTLNLDEKILKLLDRLEKAGYRGIDCSIDISLLEYTMVAKLFKDHYFVVYCYNFDGDLRFDYTRVYLDSIKETLKDIDQGFYDFIGITKKEYKNCDGISKIYDINGYDGTFSESCDFTYSVDNILDFDLETDD